jgi:hypothetical protein
MALLMATLAVPKTTCGQERIITRKQLPAAVDTVVTGLMKNAKLRGLSPPHS